MIQLISGYKDFLLWPAGSAGTFSSYVAWIFYFIFAGVRTARFHSIVGQSVGVADTRCISSSESFRCFECVCALHVLCVWTFGHHYLGIRPWELRT